MPAKVTGFECMQVCSDVDAPGRGSDLRVYGRNLQDARYVVFVGGPSPKDDAVARAQQVKRGQLLVRVPSRAASGPVMLVGADGSESQPSRAKVKIDPSVRRAAPLAKRGGPVQAAVASNTVYFDGRDQATLTYQILGSGPLDVRVDLVRTTDSTVVQSWSPGSIAPGTPQTITWNGLAGGRVGRDGQYEFRVYTGPAADQTGARSAASSDSAVANDFMFLGNVFPVRGPHNFGDAAARFGAPRSGHTHQGQDTFAACGTPLVAARGGTVKWVAYQSAAGYYLVIDGDRTGYDYGYMHLREAALVKKGQHVYTGQLIGYVGDTGDAVGCHLHFEVWTAPGWYSGGHPIDPLPFLKAWDKMGAQAARAARS